MAEHLEFGKKGEEIAKAFLLDNGYKIRERNYKIAKYEIDIIAELNGVIVIVEVKTRASDRIIEPEASVNRDKQRHLVRAANAYMRYRNLRMNVRFDIITIVIAGESHRLTHIPDAFYAMMR